MARKHGFFRPHVAGLSGIYSTTLREGVGDQGLSTLQSVFNDGNSRRGYAFAPWMLSKLFQDRTGSAATTPCAVGDPVGTIADVSGQGLYASAVSDNKRGILRQDAGGHYYIELDGVDDCYKITSITLNTEQYEWIAFNQTDATKFFFIEHGPNANSNPGHFFDGTNASVWAMYRAGAVQTAVGVSGWANGLHIGERQYIAGSGGSYLKDGAVQSNAGGTGTARSASDATDQMNLFSRNQTSLFSKGSWYGSVLCDKVAPSAAQTTAIRNLLAQKSGVSL